MAAQRKYVQSSTQPATTPQDGSPAQRPRLADHGDHGGMNPALSIQRQQLERFLVADEPEVQRYNGVLRLAIIIGSSGALCAMAAAGALRLISAI